jgi:hypothetical protein
MIAKQRDTTVSHATDEGSASAPVAPMPSQSDAVASGAARLSLLFLPLAGIMVAWFVVVARAAYHFSDPQAHRLLALYRGYLGDVVTEPPRGIIDFFFLIFFLFSAIGPGDAALRLLRLDWRDEVERALFSCAAGLIVFTFVILAVGSADLLRRPVCFVLLGLAFAATLWYWWGRWRAHDWMPNVSRQSLRAAAIRARERITWRFALGLLAGLVLLGYLYIALLGGLGPEVQFDARWYHLGQVRAYVEHGGFYNFIKDTRMAAAGADPYQTVLYTALWEMAGMVGAKLLHFGDALLTIGVLIYFCRVHFRSALMGLVAAIIFISTPLISWLSSTGGNDLQLALYTLLCLHAFLRWWKNPESTRWLIVLGLFGGYAIGSKVFGALSVALLLAGIVIVKWWNDRGRMPFRLSVRSMAICIAVTTAAIVVTCLPWLIRSTIETGSPTFPWLNSVFHSPYWNGVADTNIQLAFTHDTGGRSLLTLPRLPWDAIVAGPRFYRAVIGPLFTFILPICVGVCLIRQRRTDARRLFQIFAVYVLAWMVLWLAGGALDLRYTVAIMPIMAMLIAYLLVLQPWHGWAGRVFQVALCAIVLGITVLNTQPLVPFQRVAEVPGSFGYAYVPWMYLYDGRPDSGIAAQQPPVIQYMNAELKPSVDKVYDAGYLIIYSAYSDIRIFNGHGYDGPTGLQQWNIFEPDALVHLQQEKITYLFAATDQMNQLKQSALWTHLRPIYQPPDKSGVLFQLR